MADNASAHEAFDTGRQQLGNLYAKALLGAAGSESGRVVEELDSLLDDVLAGNPRLRAVLDSPRVPHPDKEQMLDKAFAGRMSPTLLNFLKVCSRRRRLDCLPAMRRAARRQYNEMQGRMEVRVTTAEPLQDSQRQAIQQQLAQQLGSQIDLAADVDAGLIGGMVVRVGDTVYDASVRDRLRRVRKVALQGAAQTIRSAIDKFTR